jgi:hypothetical protein
MREDVDRDVRVAARKVVPDRGEIATERAGVRRREEDLAAERPSAAQPRREPDRRDT